MDSNSKTSLYNSSSYAKTQAAKQAIYNNCRFAKAQAELDALKSDTSKKTYTLANGKVLVKQASSNRIDFKSLLGSIGEADEDVTKIITNMQKSSNSYMDAYAKISKQRLGLS